MRKRWATWGVHSAIVLSSLLLVLLLVAALDLAAGALLLPPTTQLVFPPHSTEVFESSEFKYTVQTNALGMRDREIGAQQEGACRIAVLGDSFTFGFGLELEDTWIKQLEERLLAAGRKVEVLNLGKAGLGIADYADIADRALPVLRPDILVVALLQGDDIGSAWSYTPSRPPMLERLAANFPNLLRLAKGDASPAAPAHQTLEAEARRQALAELAKNWADSLGPEQKQRLEAIPGEARTSFFKGELNISLIQSAIAAPDFMLNMTHRGNGLVETCVARTTEVLLRIKHAAAREGAQLIVLSVPHGIYVNEHAISNYASLGFHTDPALIHSDIPDSLAQEAAQAAALPFASPTTAFRQHRNDPTLFYPLDGHYTRQGCRLFAEAIQPSVEQWLGDYCDP